MSIIVSAPGKIHLLGEHAVVYGKPALLSAINKRLYVKVSRLSGIHDAVDVHSSQTASGQSSKFKVQSDKDIIIKTQEKKDLVWKAIKVFQNAFSIDKLPPIEINTTSQIPIGSGLGSSAALSSALIGALMKFIKKIWNPNRINELVYEVEKFAHGNPSGADNTTVVFGGLVWFRREFEFLKSIWSLPISSYRIPKFAIINSGRPKESTKQMVMAVSNSYAKNRKKFEEIWEDQETQTKNLLMSLKTGDKRQMMYAVKKGERNLEKIGVVGEFAQKIIREIESVEGAAKICGAGGKNEGSGIILCYHNDLSKISQIAKKYNVSIASVKLGEEGIRIEKQN